MNGPSTTLALLPSPLLGRSVWGPVAELLEGRGWSVLVAAVPGVPGSAHDVLDGFVESLPGDQSLVLVPHSNAGLYVPALYRRRTVAGTVFVDAALPPDHGDTALAPAPLYELLRTRADHAGLLPPWTRWWDDADVAALFPDAQTRAGVEAEQPRVPLSYFDGRVEVPSGWLDRPAAYVAFGDTYAGEIERARQHGWPISTLAGRHLHMLVEPDSVASTLVDMLAALDVERGEGGPRV
jgi:hypothetical protein